MDRIDSTLGAGNATGSLYNSPTQAKKTQNEDETVAQQASLASNSANISSTDASQSASGTTTADVSPAYSVEISQEGSRLSSSNATTANIESSSAGSSISDAAGTGSAGASSQTSGSSASSTTTSSAKTDTANSNTSSSESITSLSQYTDQQLKQLADDGKITRNQYNTEIAKREKEKEMSESTTAAGSSNVGEMSTK
ncbi:MAG: hypothetical protein P4N41_05290 [Negativicutes bacterium]|nr:hypothetical protein [Negativicutes bacterium]